MGLKIWQHSDKINDPVYTRKVQNRLNEQIFSILDFSFDWKNWLVTHSEYLPKKTEYMLRPSLFSDSYLDNLFRCLIGGVRSWKISRNKIKKVKDLILLMYGFNIEKIAYPKTNWFDEELVIMLDKYVDSFVDSSWFSWKNKVE